ncbi:MAG: hypothetical protein EA426_08990 [Spirochaetaceae bacterium]|nr:MAG: hypothetical protein EA426_08990 [Spirochaetaceae bacterium]
MVIVFGFFADSGERVKFLHLAAKKKNDSVWIPEFEKLLREFGSLEIYEHAEGFPESKTLSLIQNCDILITSWGAAPVPVATADEPGDLKYICHTNGGVRPVVPKEIIEAGIPVTNWGEAPAQRLAEAAFTLLIAVLKDVPGRVDTVRSGGWKPQDSVYGGGLEGLSTGIYGLGAIGRAFERMLRPFLPVVRVYDPYQKDIPETCTRVESLRELFETSEAVVIHAGLSPETEGSVNRELLALLPDHGIIINTARGAIIDQDALFAELETGRLRAGLDVLHPDTLPADHPARQWPNVIFTAHDLGKIRPLPGRPPGFWKFHRVCLENIRRFIEGEPLMYLIDLDRYMIST